MRPFTYERAHEARTAVAALDRAPDGRFLGGGTNLIDLMRLGVTEPGRLVDVSRLPYDRVEESPEGGLTIGSAVRNSVLAAHPGVRRAYPMLADALLSGASGQVRNMATTAGNLLQRTRCGYFQDISKNCNKRAPGTGCPAIDGDHRNLAIIGHSPHCVATHPSDLAVALAALDAVVHVEGPDGPRAIPITELYRLPGDRPELDTVLGPADLITEVIVPALPFAARSSYRKVRDRASFAFALVSVAAAVRVADGVVRDCRISFGGLAHMPWRARLAEEALRGGDLTEGTFLRAADAELSQARPLRDNHYKVPLARNLLARTLTELVVS